MKFLFVTVSAIVSCGPVKPVTQDLPASPIPMATSVPPTVVPTVGRDMLRDYGKVSEGMSREGVTEALGAAHEREEKTFCMNGKCRTYEYLTWRYKGGAILITLEGGVVVSTFTI